MVRTQRARVSHLCHINMMQEQIPWPSFCGSKELAKSADPNLCAAKPQCESMQGMYVTVKGWRMLGAVRWLASQMAFSTWLLYYF